MPLNYRQIQSLNLIRSAVDANYHDISYNLSVGGIIDMQGTFHKSDINIPTQGMVVAVSKERVKLPNNIVGFATVRTRLSQKGIMAINIGIIDPQYEGLISSILVNFGKNDYTLKIKEEFLRVTFDPIDDLESNEWKGLTYPVPIEDYVDNRKGEANYYFGDHFMNYDKWVNLVSKDVKKSIWKWWLAILSIILVPIGILTYHYDRIDKAKNDARESTLKEYGFNTNRDIELIREKNLELKEEIERIRTDYKMEIEKLNNQLIDIKSSKSKTK